MQLPFTLKSCKQYQNVANKILYNLVSFKFKDSNVKDKNIASLNFNMEIFGHFLQFVQRQSIVS